MPFVLSTAAFANGAVIPARFTCEGEDMSPQLDWSDAPASAKSFVLVVDDPDAPSGTFTHWVLFDIPATTRSLLEGQKPGGVGTAGKNSFSKVGYGGPCPPLVLSALDIDKLGLPAGASRAQVEARMHGHVVGTAKLVGKYERR